MILMLTAFFVSAGSFAQVTDTVPAVDSTQVVKPDQSKSQQQTNPYIKKNRKTANRFYFGGSFNFTFGTYTSIGVWPLVGIKATPKLSFGIQPGYEYLKYKDYYYGGGDYETSNYGIRIFSRYRIIPQLYAHVEYASINYEKQKQNDVGVWEDYREWVPFLFVGGGFSQRIGGSVWAYAQVLFDVIQSEKSPYRSGEPFWTIGVSAGF
jgi:hypothetical protein